MSLPSPYEPVGAVLQKLREGKGYWVACCPAHEDDHPSLSLKPGDKALLVKCHASCSADSVFAAFKALGVPMSAFFANAESFKGRSRQITGQYVYKRADGTPHMRVLRTDPKGFIQYRWDGKDWQKGLDGCERILYHLPLLAKHPGRAVWLVEGEKKADVLVKRCNLLATTAACGANAEWLPEYTQTLAGRPVVILPDNDEAGRLRARSVGEFLTNACPVVKVLELPGLPVKGDVFDYLTIHRWSAVARRELPRMAEEAPTWARWEANRVLASVAEPVRSEIAALLAA